MRLNQKHRVPQPTEKRTANAKGKGEKQSLTIIPQQKLTHDESQGFARAIRRVDRTRIKDMNED